MGFGGPIIKEGLILVISIVTLQNYFGDLGEVCSKYPGWVKILGPFDYLIILTPYKNCFQQVIVTAAAMNPCFMGAYPREHLLH